MAEVNNFLIDPDIAPPLPDPTDPTQKVTTVNLPVCNVSYAEDFFKPPPFRERSRLERTNEYAVRFGGSNDMMTLLSGSSSEKSEYLYGLFGTSIVMALFFLWWTVLMACFKGTGYRRVGFLSGRFVRKRRPRLSEETTDDLRMEESDHRDEKKEEEFLDDEDEAGPSKQFNKDDYNSDDASPMAIKEWKDACQKQEKRLFRTRIAIVISLLGVIVSCILFCIYGTKYVKQSLVDAGDGLRHIQKLARGGVIVIDNFIAREQALSDHVSSQAANINTICKVQQLCQSIDPPQDCDFTPIPELLRTNLQGFFEKIFESKEYIFDQITSFQSDLQDLDDDIEEFVSAGVDLEWAFWIAFSFSAALSALCLVMIFGIYRAHQGKGGRAFNFIRRNIVFPLFIIFVIIALVFAIVFVIAAVGTSDWCINGPDDKVGYILEEQKDTIDSVIYKFANYYVNSCRSDLAPIRIVQESSKLESILKTANDLVSVIEDFDPFRWEQECGSDNVSGLRVIVDLITGSMCLLFVTLEEVNRFFWCRQWNPIYQQLMHEAVCVSAQTGLTWVSSTMLGIAVFSFIVFFLRAAAFDIEEEDDYLRSVRRCRQCCGKVFCPCFYCGKDKEAEKLTDDGYNNYQSPGAADVSDDDMRRPNGVNMVHSYDNSEYRQPPNISTTPSYEDDVAGDQTRQPPGAKMSTSYDDNDMRRPPGAPAEEEMRFI
eukprot:CAMPEP_0172446716 /NCGR_PEP_ID=MMETSP1065-20121228/6260_1 /TAXON_ID=265537 /ORGANISM="Amphiprora paludosa, Strain CCMP125" /LENGTH=710 /DNA_ID=CAMNT_0013197905 /DNA_START=4 /DNA_END=2136 /DNA_ORIENTATION=+